MPFQVSLKSWIKKIRSWNQRPIRASTDKVFIAEGEHLIFEAAKANFQCIVIFYLEGNKKNLEQIIEDYPQTFTDSQIFAVNQSQNKAISTMDSPSKIIAVFKRPEKVVFAKKSDIVIFDQLQDAGNVGTIMRTAWALGCKNIITNCGGISIWHPKILRSAQGAHFQMNLIENQDFDAIKKLVKQFPKHQILIADMKGKSMYQQNLKPPAIWIFGNEGQGISSQMQTLKHSLISVPMPVKIDSLNVAISASILLFQQYYQRAYLP